MNISNVRIRKTFNEGALRAIASLTIDDCFAVHEIKIISSENKTFVAMPSRKGEDGVYRDIVHPIDAEMRAKLENEILDAYEKHLLVDMVSKCERV